VIAAHGLRSISAYLKKHGHETRVIFLRYPFWKLSQKQLNSVYSNIARVAEDSDLIGISSTVTYAQQAKRIIGRLKEIKIPIVWGGVHATLFPEECLEYADIVYRGEGEEGMLELANSLEKGEDYSQIMNLSFRKDGETIINPLRPLIQDLDELPFPDYDWEDHYVRKGSGIVPFHEKMFLNQILYHSVRGCPYACTYCYSSTYHKIYKGKGRIVRKKSISKTVDEVSRIKKLSPSFDYVWFTDDSFFVRRVEELEELASEYKNKVGLPFMCFLSPQSIDEKKLSLSVKSGLDLIEMGIQTGSERINADIYNRKLLNDQVIRAAGIINKYISPMKPPRYQFISTAPFEEEEDVLQTIDLIRRLPRPFEIQVFNLNIFPGSELIEVARNRSISLGSMDWDYSIDYYDSLKRIKASKKNRYLYSLLAWMNGKANKRRLGLVPRSLVGFLLRRRVIRIFENFYAPVFIMTFLAPSSHNYTVLVLRSFAQVLVKKIKKNINVLSM